jgi:hypothetical protein
LQAISGLVIDFELNGAPEVVLMFVVKPWISVESSPGPISQTLCGVPGFSFSRTMGFGFDGAAVAGAAVARAVVVLGVIVEVSGAIILAVGSVMEFVVELNGSLTLAGMLGLPGITALKSNCELCATPLGFNRNPPACAGVRL